MKTLFMSTWIGKASPKRVPVEPMAVEVAISSAGAAMIRSIGKGARVTIIEKFPGRAAGTLAFELVENKGEKNLRNSTRSRKAGNNRK